MCENEDKKFGERCGNCNKDLAKFSHVLESLIIQNINIAKDKTYGDSGLVIAIDAKWGSGKTSFLKMWKDKISEPYEKQRVKDHLYSYEFKALERNPTILNQENYTVTLDLKNKKEAVIVEYNAWENDYFGDPFISFIGQVCKQLDLNKLINASPDFFEDFKKTAVVIGSCIWKRLRQLPIVDDVSKISEELDRKIFDSQMKNFNQLSDSRNKFEEALKSLAGNDGIILFFIDELDRCRPKFAIDFLEIVKHFFNVENAVFIIALDKDALANSIRHCYGQDFDGDHYLSRIFDLELKLPARDEKFYEKLMVDKVKNGKNIDNELLCKIREYFGFSPREWKKYLKKIENLLTIPTWNRDEVYLLAAIKMYNPDCYNNIRDFNIARSSDSQRLDHFLKAVKSKSGEEIISGYQLSADSKLGKIFDSIVLLIKQEIRSDLFYMLDAIDYMF